MFFRRVYYRFSSAALTKMEYTLSTKTAQIILTNPKKRNTLSFETLTQINSHLDTINKDARTLLIKSEGPVFSSGHDLK